MSYTNYIKNKYCIDKLLKLEGGYSFDEKYHYFKDDNHFVLKIYDIKEADKVSDKVEQMKELFSLGVKCPKVFEFKILEDYGKCFTIYNFIEGDTGETIVNYDKELQYQVGYASGKELLLIHSLKTDRVRDVYAHYSQKFERIYAECKSLGLSIENEELIVTFINKNLHILKGRKTYFLHGDYHLENSVFDENGYIGCYDFNRFDYDDYISEFERASVFSRSFCLEYTLGLFDGYGFTYEDFSILRLYLAMSIFNSLYWTHKHYPEQLEYNLKLTKMVLNDYDYFKKEVPSYYKLLRR